MFLIFSLVLDVFGLEVVFAHPCEEMSGGLGGHAFAQLLSGIITCEPSLKALLRYHIIVVEAIKDIGQQF